MVIHCLYGFFYLLVVSAAVAILVTTNALAAALSLVCVIVGMAGIYWLQGAHLLAIMQLILHVGGVLVLMVYLLFLKPDAMVLKKEKGRYRKIAYFLILLLPLGIFGWQVSATFPAFQSPHLLADTPSATALSYQLVGPYSLVLELGGILLLVTLVGILYILTRKHR